MSKLDFNWNDDTALGPFLEALNLNKITGAINDANTFYPAGGTANDITISTTSGNYTYEPNIVLKFKAALDATAAMTANVDSTGPLPLQNEDGTPFTSAETGKFYTFVINAGSTAFLNAPSGSDEWGGLEFVVVEGKEGKFYTAGRSSDDLYQVDQSTGVQLNSASSPSNNAAGIGGILARLYHTQASSVQGDLYEIDPDTLLPVNGPIVSTVATYGIGGVESDRLYSQSINTDLIYELDIDTLLQLSSTGSPGSNGYGVGGAFNRLYCSNLAGTDTIYELDLDTKLQLSVANAPGLSSSTFDIGGTDELFVSNIGTDLTYKLDLDTKLQISSFSNIDGNQYGTGGLLGADSIEITKVIFEGIEYELTDDSCFRVSGVSA